ncbi:type II restriction endonuclease [Bradyrhizobium quebecense]|uniref:Type II restriction endonuclease n=2 Tax=Bradyrhizobium quebecense TaxID=2748629 RepID=A0ABS3MIX6_9BRAD|nr:type II restriction endonuclease [Bradyrhizobium quebecense]UGY06653.1 type II restriction endonuclease [Bradyrhizobium quebecense]
MKRGYLSEYFIGVAAKTLAATEIDPHTSRGHEYQGVDAFREFLGSPDAKKKIGVTYIRLEDDEPPLRLELDGTWYNSRKNQPHREPEYRLYYPAAAEEVVRKARAGDTLFFCKPKTGSLLAMSCAAGSAIEQQLFWLFGLRATGERFDENKRDLRQDRGQELSFTARYILELIEIEAIITEDEWLDALLKKFGAKFPATRLFSEFARRHAPETSIRDDPDHALITWIEFEERLFRTLERYIVSERLADGFMHGRQADVEGFIKFSLSVQNRRKSRAGSALENHLAVIFDARGLKFERGAKTENNNKPDFLFPGAKEYASSSFSANRLIMLGAKSTCKDRWRQVLAEAKRIKTKHLLTLEPGISENQTSEMRTKSLQLVLPKKLHETYKPNQQKSLLDLRDFITLVEKTQR